jgi:hypothetical protein
VIVLVGKERKLYMLPKPLLRRESLFFECCLKEGFAEARSNEIILEEEDPEIFAEVVK